MFDPSDLFFSTERQGRTVAEGARLEVEETDGCIRLTATVIVYGDAQVYEYIVSRRKSIRDASDEPYRDDAEIEERLRKTVIALAYACIDALPIQRRHASRPFIARG